MPHSHATSFISAESMIWTTFSILCFATIATNATSDHAGYFGLFTTWISWFCAFLTSSRNAVVEKKLRTRKRTLEKRVTALEQKLANGEQQYWNAGFKELSESLENLTNHFERQLAESQQQNYNQGFKELSESLGGIKAQLERQSANWEKQNWNPGVKELSESVKGLQGQFEAHLANWEKQNWNQEFKELSKSLSGLTSQFVQPKEREIAKNPKGRENFSEQTTCNTPIPSVLQDQAKSQANKDAKSATKLRSNDIPSPQGMTLAHESIKASKSCIHRQQDSRLIQLPQELQDVISDELIMEDLRTPTVRPSWNNLAKSCKLTYETVNRRYFSQAVFKVSTGRSFMRGFWGFWATGEHVSHETRRIHRQDKRIARVFDTSLTFGLPAARFLVSLELSLDFLDMMCGIFRHGRNKLDPGRKSKIMAFDSMKSLVLCSARAGSALIGPFAQDGNIWPWTMDNLRYNLADCFSDMHSCNCGGFPIGIRILETIFKPMPKLADFSLRRDGEFSELQDRALIPELKVMPMSARLERLGLMDTIITQYGTRLIRERTTNGGNLRILTEEEVDEQVKLWHEAMAKIV